MPVARVRAGKPVMNEMSQHLLQGTSRHGVAWNGGTASALQQGLPCQGRRAAGAPTLGAACPGPTGTSMPGAACISHYAVQLGVQLCSGASCQSPEVPGQRAPGALLGPCFDQPRGAPHADGQVTSNRRRCQQGLTCRDKAGISFTDIAY